MEGIQGFLSATFQRWFGASGSPEAEHGAPLSENGVRRIEPVPLRELLEGPTADFSVTSVSYVQGTLMERLYNELSTRSFVVFSIRDEDRLLPSLIQLRAESGRFFELDTAEKEKRLARFAGENRGYVLIPEIREYIKFRLDDIKGHKLLDQEGIGFEETFVPTFNQIFEILWNIYETLYHASRIRFFRGRENNSEPLLLNSEELMETKECVLERSFLSSIHYLATEGEEEEKPVEREYIGQPPPELSREKEGEKECTVPEDSEKRCVCSTHTDTGLLTAILCADVPALEVRDKESQQWVKVEDCLHERRKEHPEEVAYLIVIMGEKAPLFTGSKELNPTIHRVNLGKNVARDSLLFFMDTSKSF